MYLAIEFTGNWNKWDKISDEQYERLRGVMPGLPAERSSYDPHGTFIITSENIDQVTGLGLAFRLSRDEQAQSIGTMLVKLQDRIDQLDQNINRKNLESGSMVQIAIPDFALLMIDEVTNLDDCCTDILQEYLEDGWRILAVCPPNAQRRPDYILGRKKR